MMNALLIPLLILMGQVPQVPQRGVQDLALQVDGVGEVLYGISVPNDYDPKDPRPLVLALHPGGTRMRYYGSAYMRQVVAPGVRDLKPIIVAPDCPTQAWSDPGGERAAMALVQFALEHYSIDRRRILVVGFSLGGRGTWFMSSHHPDVFTAAIPMAAATAANPSRDWRRCRPTSSTAGTTRSCRLRPPNATPANCRSSDAPSGSRR